MSSMNMYDDMDMSSMEMDDDMDMGGMMMQMTYYWGSSVTVLFTSWDTNGNAWFYSVTLLFLFILAVGTEAWSAISVHFRQTSASKVSALLQKADTRGTMARILGGRQENIHYLLCALFYTTKLILGYQLMLAVMTYNVGISIAIFSGAFVGNFLFARFATVQQQSLDLQAVDNIACHVLFVSLMDCHEIIPGLYLGSAKASKNLEGLQSLGITAIVNVSGKQYFPGKMVYHRCFMKDGAGSGFILIQTIQETVEFITSNLKTGNVLVHCQAGMSRSPSIVLAFLIIEQNMTLYDAFVHVKTIRSAIRPNQEFLAPLHQIEFSTLGTNSTDGKAWPKNPKQHK